MKKILLIAIVGILFAATSAFACDTCKKHAPKADGQKMVCPADCDKPCCAKKADCDKDCENCSCDKKKKACSENCDKPCCKKEATATKTDAAAPCCSSMLGKPA